MKIIAATFAALIGSAAAFAPTNTNNNKNNNKAASSTAIQAFDNMPGALPPTGFFDPLGFAEKAPMWTLRRYREAELTHGRVAMLAVVGFLVGEQVAGSSFLFNGQVTGPAITHLQQVPLPFWTLFIFGIGAIEKARAKIG